MEPFVNLPQYVYAKIRQDVTVTESFHGITQELVEKLDQAFEENHKLETQVHQNEDKAESEEIRRKKLEEELESYRNEIKSLEEKLRRKTREAIALTVKCQFLEQRLKEKEEKFSKTDLELKVSGQHGELEIVEGNNKNDKSAAKSSRKSNPEFAKDINPISRLMQIQQAKKGREPVFEAINALSNPEKDVPSVKQRQEFYIQCTLNTSGASELTENLRTEGRGSTKKLAKHKAAEEMLIKMGYQVLSPILKPPTLPSTQAGSVKNEKKVKFLDVISRTDDNATNDNSKKQFTKLTKLTTEKSARAYTTPQIKQQKYRQIQQANNSNQGQASSDSKDFSLIFQISSELLESIEADHTVDETPRKSAEFYSPTAEEYLRVNGKLSWQEEVIRLVSPTELSSPEPELKETNIELKNVDKRTVNYKQMLEILANIIGFTVRYQSLLGRDGGVNSYVNLSILPNTEKPLNGKGLTPNESSNNAALCALKYLASKHH